MRTRYQIVLIVLWLISCRAAAQDIHFSQFNGSLLNISPGFTGFFNGDYRVGAIYRSQWAAVPVSYSTFNLNGETRIKPRILKKDMVGVGLVFNNDRAGDALYGTTQLYLNGSYIFLAKRDSSFMITLGANAGWCQVGFDPTRMTFDNQYDGTQYNRGIGSQEQFSWTQRNFADINVGMVIQYIVNQKHKLLYGLGVYHLTGPVISYQGNDLSKLDYKYTNYFSYITPLNERTEFIGEALYSNQGRNNEIIPHVSLKYYFNKDENKAILGGVCYRANDAVIARIGYHYKTLQSGMSYDINISRFSAATNRRGAFEVFVNYVFRAKPGFIAKKRVCPVFI